jgi:hypothetical protein
VEYVSGEKNIGSEGRMFRGLGAVLGFAGFLAVLAFYQRFLMSPLGVISAFALLYFSFYNFFQGEQSFCGTFGALGFHYGTEGLQRTEDKENRSKDMKKSLQQNSAAIVLSALFTAWTLLLFVL